MSYNPNSTQREALLQEVGHAFVEFKNAQDSVSTTENTVSAQAETIIWTKAGEITSTQKKYAQLAKGSVEFIKTSKTYTNPVNSDTITIIWKTWVYTHEISAHHITTTTSANNVETDTSTILTGSVIFDNGLSFQFNSGSFISTQDRNDEMTIETESNGTQYVFYETQTTQFNCSVTIDQNNDNTPETYNIVLTSQREDYGLTSDATQSPEDVLHGTLTNAQNEAIGEMSISGDNIEVTVY